MQITKKPYFLENKKWYKYNNIQGRYTINEDAPVKAKLSYQEFYKELNKVAKPKGKEAVSGLQE